MCERKKVWRLKSGNVMAFSTQDCMEAEWTRMKAAIAMVNQANTTKAEVEAFHTRLKRARDEVVADCRAERKRVRSNRTTADLSDASMRAAAQFTDNLPLANYDGILHLVPRLVNVVTVSLQASNTQPLHAQTRFPCHGAACRGDPRRRLGAQAAARSARHRRAL